MWDFVQISDGYIYRKQNSKPLLISITSVLRARSTYLQTFWSSSSQEILKNVNIVIYHAKEQPPFPEI